MSEEGRVDPSERVPRGQRGSRSSRGGRGSSSGNGGRARRILNGGVLAWSLGVLGLALTVYVVAASAGLLPGTPAGGLLSRELVAVLATWVPMTCAFAFGILGAFWAAMGSRVRRRRGLPYYKAGFLLGLLATFGFALAAFEAKSFPRERLVPVAFFVIALQTTIFALALKFDLRIKPSGREEEG